MELRKRIFTFTAQTISCEVMNQKRLVKKDKKIFGVCGGLGEYFDLDPTLIRAAFLVSAIIFGSGILLYIILAIVMPEGEKQV